jgi:hypothetical protein
MEPACPRAAGMVTKRTFIKSLAGLIVACGMGFLGLFSFVFDRRRQNERPFEFSDAHAAPANAQQHSSPRIGVDPDGMSRVYIARDDTPENNMARILGALGGIEKLIGKRDIVILKPNAQWWNQGMTNTNAMKAFMEAVLAIPGFEGEIIICDNHQFAEADSRGWTTQERNGDYNYNELVQYFQAKGIKNVTKYHWQCAGPNPTPLQGDAASLAKRVRGPEDGDGYVWREDLVYSSPLGRKCMLTYPVFTSSYSGTTIDLKNGAWRNGAYTGQPVKLINFSALNHHGPYVGFTASVKNFMGIVDMTCGFQGSTPKGYYNTHYIGLRDLTVPFMEKIPWRVKKMVTEYNYRYFSHTGAVLGQFMSSIRKADLNIITAHWVGYGSRTNRNLSEFSRISLASTDPVALDYIASKEILLPITKSKTSESYFVVMNDATNENGCSYRFLMDCHRQGIGNIDQKRIKTVNV